MTNRRHLSRRNPIPPRRGIDRREEPRGTCETGIRFLRDGSSPNDVLTGELLDASLNGVQLLLNQQLESGDRILVEVRTENGACFNLTAQAVWADPVEDDQFRVGCELNVELSRRQFAALQEFATAAVDQ